MSRVVDQPTLNVKINGRRDVYVVGEAQLCKLLRKIQPYCKDSTMCIGPKGRGNAAATRSLSAVSGVWSIQHYHIRFRWAW